MKNTMKNDPMKLFPKCFSVKTRIIPHPLNTNIDLAYYFVGLRKVEGYNIGIVVMRKKSLVDWPEILIGAKDIG